MCLHGSRKTFVDYFSPAELRRQSESRILDGRKSRRMRPLCA